MTNNPREISLRTAALIAGFATLLMTIFAPFAELYAYPKLEVNGNGIETVKNIIANRSLFAVMIVGYLVTFICDIIAAWAFYILFAPVLKSLSTLAAIFRIAFAMVAIVSLLNLINVFQLVTRFSAAEVQFQVLTSVNAFRDGFHFGLIFFALHLGLLGYLVWVSKYIPKVLGVFLIISALGYLTSSLQPYLFPSTSIKFVVYTFYGELIFMLWLLIRGWKIKAPQNI
jgi:hypothetical protein